MMCGDWSLALCQGSGNSESHSLNRLTYGNHNESDSTEGEQTGAD